MTLEYLITIVALDLKKMEEVVHERELVRERKNNSNNDPTSIVTKKSKQKH